MVSNLCQWSPNELRRLSTVVLCKHTSLDKDKYYSYCLDTVRTPYMMYSLLPFTDRHFHRINYMSWFYSKDYCLYYTINNTFGKLNPSIPPRKKEKWSNRLWNCYICHLWVWMTIPYLYSNSVDIFMHNLGG